MPGNSILQSLAVSAILGLSLSALAAPTLVGVCTVPGSHPTIQAAVDDLGCTDIDLAAQTFPESVLIRRTVTITGAGPSTVVGGSLRAHGQGVVVTVNDLKVEASCVRGSLQSWTGGEIVVTNVEAASSASFGCPENPIFSDGFESGDTSTWSGTVP